MGVSIGRLRVIFCSLSLLALLVLRPNISQGEAAADPAAALQRGVLAELGEDLARPSSGSITMATIDLLFVHNPEKLQAVLDRELSSLSPSLALLRECRTKTCQQSDIESELFQVAKALQAIARVLPQARVLENQNILIQAGELIASMLEAGWKRLPLALSRELIVSLIGLSDRLSSHVSLEVPKLAVQRLIKEAGVREIPLPLLGALIALYQSTAESLWLVESEKLADSLMQRVKIIDRDSAQDEIELARHAQMLFHFTGSESYRAYVKKAIESLLEHPESLKKPQRIELAAIIEHFNSKPFHVTVVGGKGDALAADLFGYGRSLPVAYKRIDWWDAKLGPMPNPDVRYPVLKRPAAYICVEKHCSLPLFTVADMQQAVTKIFNKS